MIIVRLRGGLGNQLFQYAAGKALAELHKTDFKLDLYTYTKHPYRKFELNKFSIDASEASRKEVHAFTGSNSVIRYLNKRENYFRCPEVFAQPHYHFYEDFFLLPGNLYLSGYWQSEKYFSSIIPTIKSHFEPRVALDERNVLLQKMMQSQNSVAVHVRRGDYSAAAHYKSFFGVLEESYYEQALARVAQQIKDPVFYFFSDDPSWCRKTFASVKAEFVDHNQGDDGFKDLVLISSCRHAIIANSTFSWWGAWLNNNPDKLVIAPKLWFRSNYLAKKEPVYPCRLYNTRDLIPNSWIRL